jgi:hypothetical protein
MDDLVMFLALAVGLLAFLLALADPQGRRNRR